MAKRLICAYKGRVLCVSKKCTDKRKIQKISRIIGFINTAVAGIFLAYSWIEAILWHLSKKVHLSVFGFAMLAYLYFMMIGSIQIKREFQEDKDNSDIAVANAWRIMVGVVALLSSRLSPTNVYWTQSSIALGMFSLLTGLMGYFLKKHVNIFSITEILFGILFLRWAITGGLSIQSFTHLLVGIACFASGSIKLFGGLRDELV